jgi:hypothetical protein
MSDKFIPNSDYKFRHMAKQLRKAVLPDPAKYMLTREDAEALDQAVTRFDADLNLARGNATSNALLVMRKNLSRKAAEIQVRRCANVIRASDRISVSDKLIAGVSERSKSSGVRKCPEQPPILKFKGSETDSAPGGGVHVLCYKIGNDIQGRQKPHGASRAELFVDLVMPGDPVPEFPGQYLGGRPWYLRSYTKSPIRVLHPVPPVPMLVVYWARWADARGNVGPFSKTCVARVEGFTSANATPLLGAMPEVKVLANDPKYLTTITQFRERLLQEVKIERLLPDAREEMQEPMTPKHLPRSDAA